MTDIQIAILVMTSLNTLMAAYAIRQRKLTIDLAIRKHDAKMAKKARKHAADPTSRSDQAPQDSAQPLVRRRRSRSRGKAANNNLAARRDPRESSEG